MRIDKIIAIDTSGVSKLHPLPAHPEPQNSSNTAGPLDIFGFAAAKGTEHTSGTCALACVLNYYHLGWSLVPKAKDGQPDNEAYLHEVIKWSGTPDIAKGTGGTSPMRMITSLQKAGLQTNWFANGSEEKTLAYIEHELKNQRPVIVLLSKQMQKEKGALEWQVVFQMDATHVRTKTNAARNQTQIWEIETFSQSMNNTISNANRTIITALHNQ